MLQGLIHDAAAPATGKSARWVSGRAAVALIILLAFCSSRPIAGQLSQEREADQSGKMTVGAHPFDVVSVRASNPDGHGRIELRRPDGYMAIGQPLIVSLILAYFPTHYFSTSWAYQLVQDAPSWVLEKRYDLEARVATEDLGLWKNDDADGRFRQWMLQLVLADRFRLRVSRVALSVPAFALEVAGRPSSALRPTEAGDRPENYIPLVSGGSILPYESKGDHTAGFYGITMSQFAEFLGGSTEYPVVDRTGLKGAFNFRLQKRILLTSEPTEWRLRDLSLKLVRTTISLEGVKITSVEEPSSN